MTNKKDYRKKYYDLLQFVEGLGRRLDEWDKVCDCPYGDGLMSPEHDDDCLTVQIRKDLEGFNV